MRGNNVMRGYFQGEAAISSAFAGGWFHSGDLAVWHPDGSIELRDRGKDVIICGGENISGIEVEQAIAAHPAVLECAVIAVPHPHWGERPEAFVALNDGATATPEQIIAFCRQRLAGYKCPDTIEFGPLPQTSAGKIQKIRPPQPRSGGARQPGRRTVTPRTSIEPSAQSPRGRRAGQKDGPSARRHRRLERLTGPAGTAGTGR